MNQKKKLLCHLEEKKRNLNRKDFIEYFGKERMGIPEKKLNGLVDALYNCFPDWINLIEISFLSDSLKGKYIDLLNERKKRYLDKKFGVP